MHLLDRGRPVGEGERVAFEALAARVIVEDYPCVMARSIFSRHGARLGSYGGLGSPTTAAVVCHDWYEFAREIFRVAGVAADLTPITTAEFGAAARRPMYSVLSNDKLGSLGIASPRHWTEALAAYLVARGKRV